MIPEQIINICALHPKKKRLAFSVFIRIDSNGSIQSTKFEKTIVKSSTQLTYEEAQSLIDEVDDREILASKLQISENCVSEIAEKLKILQKLAEKHRKNRTEIDIFDRDQIFFQLDNNNFPINIKMKKRLESQKIVEEMMIITNYQVAKKIAQDFGEHSLIIHHPKPLQDNVVNFNDIITDFGFKIKKEKV